jgi:hypothetical protein
VVVSWAETLRTPRVLGHQLSEKLSALRGGRALLNRNFVSSTHLCWRSDKPQGLFWLEGLDKLPSVDRTRRDPQTVIDNGALTLTHKPKYKENP